MENKSSNSVYFCRVGEGGRALIEFIPKIAFHVIFHVRTSLNPSLKPHIFRLIAIRQRHGRDFEKHNYVTNVQSHGITVM